jgi:hypothetical protein
VQRAARDLGIETLTHRLFPAGYLRHALALRGDGPAETRFCVVAGTPLPATVRREIASYPAFGWLVRTWRDREDAEIAYAGGTGQRARKDEIVKVLRSAGLKVKASK